MSPVASELARGRDRVNAALERWLPAAGAEPPRLSDAMRYAVLGDGKRLRPVLVYTTGEALGAAPERLDPPACAVELIHAYSLVHDDLPAMDDDDLRRGEPTCHRRFDEATAILAGDALQALAFELLTAEPYAQALPPAARSRMVAALAGASGVRGMAGGQAIDLAGCGQRLSLAQVERMHRFKTGALIQASVLLGALAAEAGDDQLARLETYGAAVGLAFQIVDDILDVTADTATLGKTQGADVQRGKPTYPAVLGLEDARRQAERQRDQALAALDGLDSGFDPLRELADFVVERSR
ncbi:MAG: (2E,6E)-farnesyl diphosphate synthase [Halofilum sp. (in: g-proteobacteria)]|nr:(2E,6E)-farnesyl diphosphate synthase [Halofilum sp. (in: g-proteobacteria)]